MQWLTCEKLTSIWRYDLIFSAKFNGPVLSKMGTKLSNDSQAHKRQEFAWTWVIFNETTRLYCFVLTLGVKRAHRLRFTMKNGEESLVSVAFPQGWWDFLLHLISEVYHTVKENGTAAPWLNVAQEWGAPKSVTFFECLTCYFYLSKQCFIAQWQIFNSLSS